jgi:DNA polymerase-1
MKNFNQENFLKVCDEFEFRTLKNSFAGVPPLGGDSSRSEQGGQDLNIGGLDLVKEIEDGVLKDLKVMTNLLDSEITNPDFETIKDFANADDEIEAKENLENRLKEENLFSLYKEVEKPLEKVLEKMKLSGIKTDKNILSDQSKILHEKIKVLEKEIYILAGEEFNIASPKQLGVILYEKLKLGEKIKKTAGGALSTNANMLESLKDDHKIINLILEYRELSKLLNTYVDTLPNFINETDGKIHPDFIQTGAATGRFSCENPNLQNLPAKSGIGLLVRKAFLASDGHKLISLDYSQIDLRSAAILSGDENLIEIFKENIDVHSGVAAKVFKVSLEEVTKDMRRKAKAINFGILYGMGVTALKDAMGVERKEAQEFFDEYKKTFTNIMNYLENVKKFAYEKNYTETLLGRRRQIPLLKSKLPFLKAQGERIAINAPIQGTTADILKLAMIDIDEYISKNSLENKIKILLQIHDELVLEIADDILEKEKDNLKQILENVLEKRIVGEMKKDFINIFIKNNFIKSVPLVANLKVGENLFDIK